MASAPNLDNFPADLKKLRRWVAWRYQKRKAEWTKRPLQSPKDALAWLSASEACEWVARGNADGVGFVLGDGVVCIDLDNCIDEGGTLHEIARDAVALGSYVERSPSGRGLHVLIRASISRSRNIGTLGSVPRHEIYDGRAGSARYVTVTGDSVREISVLREGPKAQAALNGFCAKWFSEESEWRAPSGEATKVDPKSIEDDAVLRIMFEAADGAKWRGLFEGDHSNYPSQSEAELALCGKLRFYTHADSAQMDRLFRKSRLMRPKWDERHGEHTYGELTIGTAISKGGPCYVPRSACNRRDSCEAKERKAYGKCPLWWVVQLKGAGELAIRVLWIITSYADAKGEAFPSVETIALHARVSERRVKVAIAKLKALGILASTYRPRRSNLYQLALRVPETITHDATHREAPTVTEPGHLGCPPDGTVTNQELTTNKHRRERGTELENQSAPAEPEDSKRSADEKALSPPKSRIPPTRSAGALRRKPSPYAGWDGTGSTATGPDLLWKYAEEKLGLVGRVVFDSDLFSRPRGPIQPELGL